MEFLYLVEVKRFIPVVHTGNRSGVAIIIGSGQREILLRSFDAAEVRTAKTLPNNPGETTNFDVCRDRQRL